jgi:hypothetical protein
MSGKGCLLFLTTCISAPVAAQPVPSSLAPQRMEVLTPLAPPATAVARVGPSTWVVTPVPGIAAATQIRVQHFGDYDLNHDGAYNPMEFAQALYFLATSDPVAGNPKLPVRDKFIQRGAAERMRPAAAVALLNATSDEFAAVDANNDGRITPEELAGPSA